MAVLIIDENEVIDLSEFFPFDDSKNARIRAAAAETTTATNDGINTREVDQFRQGVELTTQSFRFKGIGAKIWAGNTKGFIAVRTFGQVQSYTEFTDTKIFTDQHQFDPIAYLDQSEVTSSQLINIEDPNNQLEGSMQPIRLTEENGFPLLNFKKRFRGIMRGSLEIGTKDERNLEEATNIIEQFAPVRNKETDALPFLDGGQRYFGNDQVVDGAAAIAPGDVQDGNVVFTPFDDRGNARLTDELFTPNGDIAHILNSSNSDSNLDNSVIEIYDKRSAAAGSTVYGPNQAKYGTDSIAYVGCCRGS